MNKYKAIIFDFDFTLVDATVGIVTSVNYALNKLNYASKDTESIRKLVGRTLIDTFHILTSNIDEEETELFLGHFKEKADEIMTDNTRMFEYTEELLSKLKQSNYKVGIVSSKRRYRIVEVLDRFGLSHYVDYIVGYEDVTTYKPSKEGLEKCIDYFNLNKSEVLYVGDTTIDAETAHNANVDFFAVTTGTTIKEDFLEFNSINIGENLKDLLVWLYADL